MKLLKNKQFSPSSCHLLLKPGVSEVTSQSAHRSGLGRNSHKNWNFSWRTNNKRTIRNLRAASVVQRWACWPWYPSTPVQTRPKPSDFSREKKILSAPSFGREVKPSVPCRKFTSCKRTQKWRGSRHFRQNSRRFLAHSSTFRCWGSLASFQTWGHLVAGVGTF